MKKINFTLIVLLIWTKLVAAQNITGKWYEIEQHDQLEITIQKKEHQFLGTYSLIRENKRNILHAPIQNIRPTKDSLILVMVQGKVPVVYRLKHDSIANVYQGMTYKNGTMLYSVTLSRQPVKRTDVHNDAAQQLITKQDSIRGMITPERVWWDLTYYHLEVKVEPDSKYISGKNTIQYKVLKSHNIMQIDLQPPLKLTKAIQNGQELNIRHDGNAHYIYLNEEQLIGKGYAVEVFYEGHPLEAVRAPWDGGVSWEKDPNGKHFIATSCQKIGASIWWPNKDHMYDEVDSMLISITHPKGLRNISNGRLRALEENIDQTITSHWFVSNPINNYGVNMNIGDYVHFSEQYQGEKGKLDIDYYVLRDNIARAKVHFADVPKMMEAFEYWFGPYPFYEDGYKLVEVPYLGMEHQSSVTYGNQYKKGYLGMDLSGTGWGLKFDFIIVHESGHEWFANNITYRDVADMWIHESFINYSESLFLDYHYGRKAASSYVIGTRKGIRNDRPIIGQYGVNKRGSGDMYAKGGNMLHTLRQVINDDEQWRQILRGLNETFYHQTVSGKQIETYISQQTGMNLTPFFDQYLRTIQIPTLEYYSSNKEIVYRWINVVEGFDMPVKIFVNQKKTWIYPNKQWTQQFFEEDVQEIIVDPNFYITELKHPLWIKKMD